MSKKREVVIGWPQANSCPQCRRSRHSGWIWRTFEVGSCTPFLQAYTQSLFFDKKTFSDKYPLLLKQDRECHST